MLSLEPGGLAIVDATSHVSSDPKQRRRIVGLSNVRPDQLMPLVAPTCIARIARLELEPGD
jgi:hypothetical protein